jgi:Ca-activated chloride channel homolog
MNRRQFLTGVTFLALGPTSSFHLGLRPSFANGQEVSQEPDLFSLEVNVDLVVLNVTVLDERGLNVTTLKQEDFSIYEDDAAQDISFFLPVEAPFNLILVLDTSVSTRTSLSLIKRAASNFTDELRPNDHIAVAEINYLVRAVQDFTSDRKILRRVIHSLTTFPYGGSKVYDGMALALSQLRAVKGGRRAMVLLSDGMENSSSVKFEELRRMLAGSDVVLYPVTILNKDQQKNLLEAYIRNPGEKDPPVYRQNAKRSLSVLEEVYQIQTERLQALADETGGKMFMVGDLADLAGQYSKVAQELRNTFSLAYYSKNPVHDDTMRKIRVEVRNPKYQVRTRTNYFVPKD